MTRVTCHIIISFMLPNEFLSYIWPRSLLRGETLELRAKEKTSGKIKRQFFTSTTTFLEACQLHQDTHNIYFGVSTRFEHGGKKADCYRTRCVWLDFDKPDLPTFEMKPDIIVNSGTGFHVYWLLDSTVFVRSGRWIEIEAINRAIANKYHGDIAAIDVSRVLRMPGTFNHKHNPARQVRVADALQAV